MKEVTYGVWANWNEYTNGDNDSADWYNSCDEALEAARDISSESGGNSYVMKTSDGEIMWDSPIEVNFNGGAWSDCWSAREEMGCVQ